MRTARGYGDLKAAAAEAVIEMLAPVRERYEALRADEEALQAMLAAGAEKARAIAADTLADVREAMGVGAPRGRRPTSPVLRRRLLPQRARRGSGGRAGGR